MRFDAFYICRRSSGVVFAAMGLLAALWPGSVFAAERLRQGAEQARPDGVPENLLGSGGIFETIANTLLFLLGAVAVLMLILGGFRYVVSGGDASAVEGAKNTVLYAIVGIVVAFLAYAAVNFVIVQLETPAGDI